jgi:ABC-type Fe3+ transport system substrate-binding protein
VAEKRRFVLVHALARQRAAQAVEDAPAGHIVTVQEPARNLDQNALMWVLLQAFADQLEWPVNGRMAKLAPEEWKDILSAAFKQELQRVAPGLNGGMVLLGMRTSKMGKAEFGEFIEFIQATAVERAVVFDEETA